MLILLAQAVPVVFYRDRTLYRSKAYHTAISTYRIFHVFRRFAKRRRRFFSKPTSHRLISTLNVLVTPRYGTAKYAVRVMRFSEYHAIVTDAYFRATRIDIGQHELATRDYLMPQARSCALRFLFCAAAHAIAVSRRRHLLFSAGCRARLLQRICKRSLAASGGA